MSELEPKRLATVHNERQLLAVFRTRQDELSITRETIDAASGLQSGYSSKLLAPEPIKHLGRTSLGALLGVLGLALCVVEDREALRQVHTQLVKRKRHVRPA